MEALEGTQQLCGVEASAIELEAPRLLEVPEELAAVDEAEDEEEFGGGLEGELQGDDEGVVDLGEDEAFGHGVGDFGAVDDVFLVDGFYDVDAVGV